MQKTDELYHLYYQYIAEEPSYNELYYSGLEILNDTDYSSSYIAKEVSGRTNKLSFKLCHDYCETCFIISKDNDHQLIILQEIVFLKVKCMIKKNKNY